jgi:hypothetical protein
VQIEIARCREEASGWGPLSGLNPFCRRNWASLKERPRRDGTQSGEACRYPDHRTVAADEGFGDRVPNAGMGNVGGCEQRPGGINLSTNLREQGQSIQRLI